jgi:hypothetical protein
MILAPCSFKNGARLCLQDQPQQVRLLTDHASYHPILVCLAGVLRLVHWTQPRPVANPAERGCARRASRSRYDRKQDGLSYQPTLVCLANVLRLVHWTQPRPVTNRAERGCARRASRSRCDCWRTV